MNRSTQQIATILLAPILVANCIRRYDTESLSPSQEEIRAANRFTYLDQAPPDKVTLINAEWAKLGARCSKIRAAMQKESDGISSKNAWTGAVFAATTAGLALASGLYTTAKGEDADPTISAGLALGAGASAVPTFFYFGSDEREKTVNSRIEGIDSASEQVQVAWQQFNTADTKFTQDNSLKDRASQEYDAARNGGTCDQLATAPEKRKCEALETRLKSALEAAENDVAAWHQATNALDQSVQRLLAKCR